MQPLAPVEFHILTGIDDVEPRHPEEHRKSQKQGDGGQRPEDCHPGAHGRTRERKPQEEVRGPGKPLRVRIEKT